MKQLKKLSRRRDEKEIILEEYDQEYLLEQSFRHRYYILAERVLRNKIDVNHFRDEKDRCLLHIATMSRDLYLIKLLVTYGADINKQTENEGFTPLILAIFLRDVKLVRCLLKNNADTQLSVLGVTPLMLAIQYNEISIIKELLKFGCSVNPSSQDALIPLELALEQKSLNIVKILLDNNADVNFQNQENGRTASYYAAKDCNIDLITLLLKHKVNMNYECLGFSCMYVIFIKMLTLTSTKEISSTKAAETAILLLQNGLDVNVESETFTPLEIATSFAEGFSYEVFGKLIAVLLLYNADRKSIQDSDISLKLFFWYQMEIARMKTTKITDYYSVYDLLFMDKKKLVKFVDNESLRRLRKIETRFSKMQYPSFPEYDWLLVKKLNEAKQRKIMLVKTSALFEEIKINLPQLCYDKICDYLSDSDLENFVKAKEFKKSTKRKSRSGRNITHSKKSKM